MSATRRGFVLLSVLWFLFGVTALSLGAMYIARSSTAVASNRIALITAEWRAEDCAARARAAMIDIARENADLEGSLRPRRSAEGWARAILSSPLVAACPGRIHLEPFGGRLDVNNARASTLRRVFEAAGIPAPSADSLVDALLDWRDADDEPRPLGAEREWYRLHGRTMPRNGVLGDAAELHRVRGFADWQGAGGPDGLAALFTVDSGRVLLTAAPSVILHALPGLTPSAVAAIEAMRASAEQGPSDLFGLLGMLPSSARPDLERSFVELGEAATMTPEGWILRARASGVPDDPFAERLQVEIELRLVADGPRHTVVRRRIAP